MSAAELEAKSKPIPMRLPCPRCGELHIDTGEFATKPHRTHLCLKCGEKWCPALIATTGVEFLSVTDGDSMQPCGHPLNPPIDKDRKGRPYLSCYWCFVADVEHHAEAMDRLANKTSAPIINANLYDVKYEYFCKKPRKPDAQGKLPDEEYEPRVESVLSVHAFSVVDALAQAEFRLVKSYMNQGYSWKLDPVFGNRPRHLAIEVNILDVAPHSTSFTPAAEPMKPVT